MYSGESLLMHRKPDVTISDEARKQAVASIKRYFEEELEQEIGELKEAA